jgi:phosphate transport system permease protein
MSKTPPPKKNKVFESKGGFQILGFGLQDAIRYFFGGNALLAIVVLILISLFLAREAFFFFPDHLKELRAYRDTGQEYVGFLEAELIAHRKLTSEGVQAFNIQVRRAAEDELAQLEAAQELKSLLRDEVEDARGLLKKAEENSEVLEIVGGEAYEIALAKTEKRREELQQKIAEAVKTITRDDLERTEVVPGKALFERLKAAAAADVAGGDSPLLAELEERSEAKQAVARERYSDFETAIAGLDQARQPLTEMWSRLRDITAENRSEVDRAATAPRRKAAYEDGARLATTPEARAENLQKAKEVDLSKPDPEVMTDPVYAAKDDHQAIRQNLRAATERYLGQFPETLPSKVADKIISGVPKEREKFFEKFDRLGEKTSTWSHRDELTMWHSVTTFFLGTEWVTNSSWNDVYGLLPLFSGSSLIAIIAIGISVPFAVGSAIYVNQIARPLEQNIIKPTIEFIEAIPSIVLGFFGIVVLGDVLRDLSQWEFLSWVPGFPMSERLNILNAGLLLAFMAIPTIFTLAEDALNNVPKAYRDASLALGSTRLQTLLKVVVPTALSGIVAAVLLGFGRIIGETMVVLLVAGNKIAMPEWSEGLGVLTQPTHTMTGIIAQETGEVEQGSLHWRALFMVGMVLFCISLFLNFLSQRVLKKFGNKG